MLKISKFMEDNKKIGFFEMREKEKLMGLIMILNFD